MSPLIIVPFFQEWLVSSELRKANQKVHLLEEEIRKIGKPVAGILPPPTCESSVAAVSGTKP